jgi:hypothetical protein
MKALFKVRLLWVGMSQMNMIPKTFPSIPNTKCHLNMSSSSSDAADRNMGSTALAYDASEAVHLPGTTTSCGKRHNRLSNYELLKKDTVPWN